MNTQNERSQGRRRRLIALVIVGLSALVVGPAESVRAVSYQRISGEGSSWSANAIDAMRVNVAQFGIAVDYNPSGSTSGRKNFLNGTVDFASSDIPFQFKPEDGSAPETPAAGSYAYMPVVAGGTAFMYNLKINGKQVTNLRLSGSNVAKIFTGVITQWNDPLIAADNPGLTMPARPVVPVVRSEGSGSTAQFTLWMIKQYPDIWTAYCNKSGRAPKCGETSFYPTITGMIAQAGDLGVAGYVTQGYAEGAIGYVNYSYALSNEFPVAKVLNAAGYYTEPTPQNVAVSLLQARINTNEADPTVYLTQQLDGVYTDPDPRNYPLSSYSYLILPTKIGGQFTEDKGFTLGAFSYYAMCQAQQGSAALGYSPMPVNLVEAGFEQIRKIPGVQVQDIDIAKCNNPTFSPDGTNVLAANAPQPKACDKQGTLQCADGTAGMANVPTAVSAAASGATAATTPATAAPAAGASPTATTAVASAPTPASGGAAPAGAATDAGAGVAAPAAGATTGGAAAPATGGAGAAPAAGGASTGAATPGVATASGGNTATGVNSAAGGVTGPATGAAVDPATGAAVDPAAAAAIDPATGAVVDPAASAAAPQSCDADTGLCAASAAIDPGTVQVAQAAAVGSITPTTLADSSGWGASVVLTIIVVLLTLALILVPAVAWRRFSTAAAR